MRYAHVIAAATLAAAAGPAFAVETPNTAAGCNGEMGIVLAARTPEVDLFDAPAGGQRVSSIPKAKFPTCLRILEQSPSRMLKVDIEGKQYWVQPHMVQTRMDAPPPVCRTLAEGAGDQRAGSTRGLGEGC